MAGRCGCSSSNATGASISAGACVTVTGAGTTASPAVIGVEIDPSDANNLQCGAAGLFAGGTLVETSDDALGISGDGSNASPYELSVNVSAVAGQALQKLDDGLYVAKSLEVTQGSSTLFGGALPADPNWVAESGTYVGNSDVDGHIHVPIFVDLLGILSIVWCLGDRPVSHTEANMDMGSVTLDGFDIVVEDAEAYGTPIVAGTYRINYTVIGWFAA